MLWDLDATLCWSVQFKELCIDSVPKKSRSSSRKIHLFTHPVSLNLGLLWCLLILFLFGQRTLSSQRCSGIPKKNAQYIQYQWPKESGQWNKYGYETYAFFSWNTNIGVSHISTLLGKLCIHSFRNGWNQIVRRHRICKLCHLAPCHHLTKA